MPTPQRVYCDFSNGDGNFYQYIGNLMDNPNPIKFKGIDDLKEMCVKMGLEPVEILSKK